VEASENHEHAAASVVVGDRVSSARAGNVDLDCDEVRLVIEAQWFYMLVYNYRLIV
jgi:hypothetical protein